MAFSRAGQQAYSWMILLCDVKTWKFFHKLSLRREVWGFFCFCFFFFKDISDAPAVTTGVLKWQAKRCVRLCLFNDDAHYVRLSISSPHSEPIIQKHWRRCVRSSAPPVSPSWLAKQHSIAVIMRSKQCFTTKLPLIANKTHRDLLTQAVNTTSFIHMVLYCRTASSPWTACIIHI